MKNVKLSKLWDSLHSSYWFLPTLMAIGAACLALIFLSLDRIDSASTGTLGWIWLYTGGPDGARATLSTIAGSMATVAATAFSITIVALQLASSHFGPRLLRNFMQDTGNQIVLGTFISTFIYCLLVLRTIRSDNFNLFVPQISVTIGIVLAIASIGVLIYFIHHASTIIQAANVIASVSHEFSQTIDRLFPEELGKSASELQWQVGEIPQNFQELALPIHTTSMGYLQVIDEETLLHLAHQHQLLLQIQHRPGKFIIPGDPLVLAYPAAQVTPELTTQIQNAFLLGKERTEQQDIAFPIEQLVEIALRAISPAVNDPFTAIRCIDRLGAGLACLAQRAFPSAYRYDEAHALRVMVEPVTFAQLVNIAFTPIRQYAQTDASVTVRLLETIARIATRTQEPNRRAVLQQQADMIKRGSEALAEPNDRHTVKNYYDKAVAALNSEISR